MWEKVLLTMEEQIPPSQQVPADQPFFQRPPEMPQLSPSVIEQLKARAREEAIRMTLEQRAAASAPQEGLFPGQQPNVVYVRRNFTVAELLLTLLLACGIVTGLQFGWKVVSNSMPHIEIKVK